MTSNPARAIADLNGGTILATVDIAVPPERVFRALTAAEDVLRWWGSDEHYRTTKWACDLRVGGKWRAEGSNTRGLAFAVEGEFLEIDPPRRLVQTWRADWDGSMPTTVAYQLDPIEGGTRLIVRHDGFQGRPGACQNHAEGWKLVFKWLTAYVSPKPEGEERFFMCRLVPPRPTFPLDMSPSEQQVMKEHAAYLTSGLDQGKVIVFGPVADPNGSFGLAIVRTADETALRGFLDDDPAIRADIGLKYEVLPILHAQTQS